MTLKLFLIPILSLLCLPSSSSGRQLPVCVSARFDTGDDWIVVENTKYVKILTEDEDTDCQVEVNALLVGAGGDTNTFLGHGGGSGYVTNQMITVPAPVTLRVTVGRGGNFGTSGDSTLIEIYGQSLVFSVVKATLESQMSVS